MSDRFVDNRWFGVLTVVDQFTRECALLYADRTLSGEKVATELEGFHFHHPGQWERVCQCHGCLGIRSWNPLGVHPTRQTRRNGHIESFNGGLRDECLNVSLLGAKSLKNRRKWTTQGKILRFPLAQFCGAGQGLVCTVESGPISGAIREEPLAL